MSGILSRGSLLMNAAQGNVEDFQRTFLDVLGSFPDKVMDFGSMCEELRQRGCGNHVVTVAVATCQAEIRKNSTLKNDAEILALLFPRK